MRIKSQLAAFFHHHNDGRAWICARYRTFGVDVFDPCGPAAQRRLCSVGAAMTLVEAVSTLREIADGPSSEHLQHAKIAAAVSDLLSIEIDAGLL